MCVREKGREILEMRCFWQDCKDSWKLFVLLKHWWGVTRCVSVREGELEHFIKGHVVYTLSNNPLLHPAWLAALSAFHFLILCQFSLKTFSLLSEAISPYPGLLMKIQSFPVLLHLSVRGMSFNMAPVTSHSEEAHRASHSPCPLFLNEGHMRCGQHWS